MKKYVIIVAGGAGKRMNSTVPKQFLLLNGYPVLMHTLSQFFKAGSGIEQILVLPSSQISFWKKLCTQYNFTVRHTIVSGGKTRFHSVKNGLNFILSKVLQKQYCSVLIAIHDGVRPSVSTQLINRVFSSALKHHAVIPVMPVCESLRKISGIRNQSVERAFYRTVQTPQCFSLDVLQRAYRQRYNKTFTDDASVIESTGTPVYMVEGESRNIKITTPDDMKLTEFFLKI